MARNLTFMVTPNPGAAGRLFSGDFSVTDIRELQKRLKAIDPRLRTELVREAKAIAAPMNSDIKNAIGSVRPLSGMLRDKGRLGWGVGVPVNKTTIQWRTSTNGRSDRTSLVRIKVSSPAAVIADMAGRSGRYVGEGRRNDNATGGKARRNHSTRKGLAFIASLNAKIGHAASRMVYPAAERSMPEVTQAVDRALRSAFARINAKGL